MPNLVVGCGYLGLRVAKRWISEGKTVFATTRKQERISEFRNLNIQPVQADITNAFSLSELPEFDEVLFSVGFDRKSGKSIDQVYVNGLKQTLRALDGRFQHLIYISSTGVYGQTDAEWVDEDSECNPTREGGKACLDAERLLDTAELRSKSCVLRLAGIYGPDRVPRIEQLNSGDPFACETDGFLNLIHVDDAASVVLESSKATSHRLLCVSDGVPVNRREFYEYAAQLLGKRIEFAPVDPNSAKGQRAAGNKRIRNLRMQKSLNLTLQFPDYRAGLESILVSQ